MKGIQESGIAPAAKHWPGDGIDERDQHLSFSVNSLSTVKNGIRLLEKCTKD